MWHVCSNLTFGTERTATYAAGTLAISATLCTSRFSHQIVGSGSKSRTDGNWRDPSGPSGLISLEEIQAALWTVIPISKLEEAWVLVGGFAWGLQGLGDREHRWDSPSAVSRARIAGLVSEGPGEAMGSILRFGLEQFSPYEWTVREPVGRVQCLEHLLGGHWSVHEFFAALREF